MVAEATVKGIPDLRDALLSIGPKLRQRALRNALAAGARIVRNAAKGATPVLSAPVRNKSGQVVRKPSTVRDAISVRTSKRDKAAGDVGVFVNVRPATGAKFKKVNGKATQVRGSKRGAYSPDDPYYWRWLEFGWNPASKATGGFGKKGKAERRKLNKSGSEKARKGFEFLQTGAKSLPQALEVFKVSIARAIERLNKKNAPAP